MGGGGVIEEGEPDSERGSLCYPSPMLRMGPLPIGADGEEQAALRHRLGACWAGGAGAAGGVGRTTWPGWGCWRAGW